MGVLRWLRTTDVIARNAFRALRRAPAYVAVVFCLLAIGITAGAVTFSVVDAVLLKPLPIEDGDRLVMIGSYDVRRASRGSPANLLGAARSLADVAPVPADFRF